MTDETRQSQDVLDLLLEDHEEVRMLLDELERCEPESRRELFRYTVARLASHEAAEQAVIHAVVLDEVEAGRDIAAARIEEEEQAEEMLAEMSQLDPIGDEFRARLADLRQAVRCHLDNEERDEFPLLHAHLDPTRRRQLGTTFRMLREAGPTRPHPKTTAPTGGSPG